MIRDNAINLLGCPCKHTYNARTMCTICIKCCKIQINYRETSKPLPMHEVYLLYNYYIDIIDNTIM